MVKGICEWCVVKGCESGFSLDGECPPKFREVLQFVKSKCHSRDCNVDYVIREKKFKREKLYYYFEFYFGITPGQFLELLRFKLALNLFTEEESINKVCKNCGYTYVNTFRTAFEKNFLKPPTEIRAMLLAAEDKKALINKLILGVLERMRNRKRKIRGYKSRV